VSRNVVAITTLEDTVGVTGMNNGVGGFPDAIDLRTLQRGDTMTGFDNRQFDFEDPLMKQREQELRMKNSMLHR